jgi:signal transduction histidine kinase
VIDIGRQDLRTRLDGLEVAMARLQRLPQPVVSDDVARALATLADHLRAVRAALDHLDETEQSERHQLGHDLRSPLNAIAGWSHILRTDGSASPTARRAADVFDRNVRAMTKVIEAYTADTL